MNEIVNKFLLAGDKLMPKIHLRQQEFRRYIYQNELHKASFQHDMAYWDFKDLSRA